MAHPSSFVLRFAASLLAGAQNVLAGGGVAAISAGLTVGFLRPA
jgi:hypothetical protein